MPSNKETLFQNHICAFLRDTHKYLELPARSAGGSSDDLNDNEFHFIEKHLIEFITTTQPNKYAEIEENYGTDTNNEIIKALREEAERKSATDEKAILALKDNSSWVIFNRLMLQKQVRMEEFIY